MRDTPKRPGKLEHRKGRLRETWVRIDKMIFKERGTELEGVRAIARDLERWKALCEP
jgi:hypothetical protein